VQFLDVADSSIMNVALPSIRRDLGFSAQDLQWVLSGYHPVPGSRRAASRRLAAALRTHVLPRSPRRPQRNPDPAPDPITQAR